MKKLIGAGLIVAAACAHGSAKPESPQEELVSWANKFPLAAAELCMWERNHPQDALRLLHLVQDRPIQVANALQFAAMHPGMGMSTIGGGPSRWEGHVALPGDAVVETLLGWASRHPDAAQQLDVRVLEWTAAHHGC